MHRHSGRLPLPQANVKPSRPNAWQRSHASAPDPRLHVYDRIGHLPFSRTGASSDTTRTHAAPFHNLVIDANPFT